MIEQKTVVVLGKFDGVHIAHAKLIDEAVKTALQRGAKSLVYSMQKSDIPAMTDKQRKLDILKSLGIDEVVFKELDEEFMSISAERFVHNVLKQELNACCVVVGENFRFGKDRSADSLKLKELCIKDNIDVIIIDTVSLEDHVVSSTYVRELISEGSVHLAGKYLGRPFSIKGCVTTGKHLGRSLGFPTANIYPEDLTVVPKSGVYATCVVYCGKRYPSITNVGVNPTVENGKNIKVETHILQNTDNWYSKEITVEFHKFIRDEIQFKSIDELKKQVETDKQNARKFHNI